MNKHSIAKREKASSPLVFDLRLRWAAGHATSVSRRTGKTGAAAAGLFGMAFLPLAIAHADDWTIDPPGIETITGIYGHGFSGGDTAPPAVAGSIQGDQVFDYTNPSGDSGTFSGFESYSKDRLGDINTATYAASDLTGSGGPPVGSVFDSYSFEYGAYTNLYSAVPNGEGSATITDTLVTPTGNIVIPITFNAADGLVADAGGVPTGNGGMMSPVDSQLITSISGIPPLTIALQGEQDFNFYDLLNDPVGTVSTVDTTTADGAGPYIEAVLV